MLLRLIAPDQREQKPAEAAQARRELVDKKVQEAWNSRSARVMRN